MTSDAALGEDPSALRGFPLLAAVLALSAAYIAAARLGLLIDAVAGFATLVWAPTGIALAALVRFGYRLWPGVFVGAAVANLLTGAPLLVAIGIGIGNTLEAVVATYALRRIPGFRPSLDRLPDALGLIVLAAGLSTTISATVGVVSLRVGGILPAADAGVAWRAWWLGDLIGAVVVAPVLLAWSTASRVRVPPRRLLEAVALAGAVVAINFFIFAASPSGGADAYRRAYLIFPALIWAALRFGQLGAASMTFLTSIIAIWGTAVGHGPFAQPVLRESLFALQTFMGVAAATFLVLGATIAERHRAAESLQRAHETVTEANRAKSEFLAVMSHELRTPLNAICGYVDLLSLDVDGGTSEAQRTYLARIRSNQQHLTSMINDVLSFAKVETGRLSLTLRAVSVGELLATLDSLVEPELRRKGVSYTSMPSDPALLMRGDPERLRQILLNLVLNAVKFTDAGGSVVVAAVRDGGIIRISVRDSGIGIPPDQLERIFEPFFQVDRGMTRRYSGIGLGLAIARDFARAMGGEVRLESQPGKGSTAFLEVPAA